MMRTIAIALLAVCGAVAVPDANAGDKVVTVWEKPASGPASTLWKEPFAVDQNKSGTMYAVDFATHRVGRLTGNNLELVAGSGVKGIDAKPTPLADAKFNGLHGIIILPDGRIWVADTFNHRVCEIDEKANLVRTVIGTGEKGFNGDGHALDQTTFSSLYSIAANADGTSVVIADLDNRRVRVADLAKNVVRTVAGNGKKGSPEDGAKATQAPLVDPRAATYDASGRIYLLDRGGHALRLVDLDGTIRTLVGTGKAGMSGDGVPGRKSPLNGPKHLCTDKEGNVLIADTENHLICRYEPATGNVVRVAGTGRKGAGGVGGDPREAQLNRPHGVFVDQSGVLYIVDSENARILKIVRE